jgi:predicted dehydrogenase
MKVGVVGCGYLGSRHAMKLSSRRDLSGILLHDVRPDRARALAEETGAVWARSLDEVTKECRAVIVATSTDAHADVALTVLDHGGHVLVEKPIAATLADADRMVARAGETGRVLMVGHVERFNPAIRRLEGRLVLPRFIEGHRLALFQPRSLDIDVVLDLMIHDIDLVLHFARELPFRVDAAGTKVLTSQVDIANARLAFPGGMVANLTASRVSVNRTRKIRLFMPRQYVSIDLAAGQAESYCLQPGSDQEEPDFLSRISHESLAGDGADALEAEQDAFLKAVRGEAPVVVPGHEGRAALAVALEVLNHLQRFPG